MSRSFILTLLLLSLSLPAPAGADVLACRTDWERHDGQGLQSWGFDSGPRVDRRCDGGTRATRSRNQGLQDGVKSADLRDETVFYACPHHLTYLSSGSRRALGIRAELWAFSCRARPRGEGHRLLLGSEA